MNLKYSPHLYPTLCSMCALLFQRKCVLRKHLTHHSIFHISYIQTLKLLSELLYKKIFCTMLSFFTCRTYSKYLWQHLVKELNLMILLCLKYYHNLYIYHDIVIATLGSILDSQLSWESGKFQLARWSHEVVLFPERTSHPSTQPYGFSSVSVCGVPTQVWISSQIPSIAMCDVPPCFSNSNHMDYLV